ncbi:MAG: type II toxin-antitoxin system mRNA interferase toxin, RelE/StbE family [Minisyncoccales bacterium]|jgi:addiction module RelE/StbE family toxin
MIIKDIVYTHKFLKSFKELDGDIKKIAAEKEKMFEKNPFHSSLRLHCLKGRLSNYWSISVNTNYRIIFEYKEGGDVLFLSIGKHDIYRNL